MSQNVEDVYPLTPLQEGMLFHTLEAPGSGVYVERLGCELRGSLDPAAFRRAWEETLARHPVLRTAFLWQGLDRPRQVVRRAVRLPWQEEDWRELSTDDQEARLAAYLDDDLRRGFDVVRAPLMRVALFRTGERVWRLIWTHHHLLLDGWARAHVMADVLAFYAAGRHGAPVRPFRDYVAWLKGPGAQTLQGAEAFWRRTLAGFASPTPLAFAGSGEGQEDTELALTAAETSALQDRARRERITLNTLVQGAWAVLLARTSGEEDVVYGNVVSGRPASLPGAEAMVGPFINTLPVRARMRPDQPAADWLRRFQEELAAQRRYEHTSLLEIQAWSEVPRGTPLFETLVVFENHPDGGVGQGLRDLEIGDLRYDSKAHYPLSLVAFPGESLRLQLKHERSRVDGATADKLLARLGTLLNALAADADRPLSELPWLPEAERREALARAGTRAGTRRPQVPDSLTIHGLFAERAAATPDAVAVEHDGAVLTYAELDRRAERLAQRLDVRPGTVVGLEVERSPELIIGMLGILKAGAAYLPLDPSHPAERRQALLEDAGALFVVTREVIAEETSPPVPLSHLPSTQPRERGDVTGTVEQDRRDTLPDASPLSRRGAGGRWERGTGGEVSADALAYVLYTSGSTGRPKGVAVSHRAVLHLLLDTDYVRLEPDDVVAQVATPAFDAATFEIWGPLLAGARLSIVGRYDSLHPPGFAARLAERGVTTLFLTTALFNAMAREAPAAFAGLRHVLFGGEAVDPGAVRAILDAGPPQRLLHVYGPTEATTFSTWHLVRDVSGTVPIGGPIAGTRALILDLWGGLAPDGVAGELCLGGDGLARGYLGRPDLTAERFVPDPTEPGRLYRTGDLVRRTGSGIEFLGRTDHQVKVRGFRIEPGEVEAALREHPAVKDVLVAAIPDPNGGRRLAAWWVRRPGSQETDLRAVLGSRLPEPMVPSAFVEMDELPLNASGKVDRSRLPEPNIADTVTVAAQAGAPLTPVQELLAGIVAGVLRRERIDVRESFLGLGGHSLMATQVVSRTREAFGVDLPLAAIFEEPSIAGLADRIETLLVDGRAELPPLTPAPRDGNLQLSWSQERLWILDQLEPGLAAYNIPLSARLEGSLDVEALRASLGEIVRRHEALRTRFTVRGGAPVQEIQPFTSLDLPVIDAGDEAEAMAVARREAARPFDLERDSLIRAVLLRLSGTDHVLLVNFHHIVSDGWSTGVLLRELSALYPAFLEDRPSPLADLPIQYADFAVWQRGWLQGEALERELAFWRRTLEDVPELDLPTDRPRRSVNSFEGGLRTAALGPDLAGAVANLCQAAKVTPFMALLAAWELLLARYAGQEDFAVGVPVANRDRIEIEGLIGFFVNTIVIRTSPAGTVLETLKRVRETALAAFAHRDMPFQKLVEELQPRRSQQLSPFFQVFFALQNAPMPPLTMPGLTLSAFPMDTGTAKFELSLSLIEDEGGWAASLEHSRDLFDGATAERLLRHFAALLGAMAGAPERPASELPLLSEAESRQILVDWNDTERPGSAGSIGGVVHRLFEEIAASAPDSVALLRGEDRITYAELNRQANRLARRLRTLGVGPETPVGVFLDSSPELIVAYLAALKAGGAYLPLVPSYPRERLEFMLEETGAPVVLTRGGSRGRLEGLKAAVLAVDEPIDGEDSNLPALVESGAGLAYVMYTSGSTGRPKGVAVNHEGIVRLVRDSGFADLGPDQVFLQITAISFDVSTFEIWGALLNGGRLAFLPTATLSLQEIGEAIARHGVTTLWLSSGLFSLMVDGHLDDLRPLRQLLAGGDVVPLPQARRVLEEIPGCRLIDGYGPTENTTFTACRTVTRADLERPSIPIGRPLNNTTVYVLDGDLRPVPVGVRGGLYTGGLGLARGYFGRPDLTAGAFVPHPFGRPGERLYNTGDIARWLPEGTGGILEFLGRRDTQVKVRGFRIELGEIEATLAEHPAVRQAVVLATGEGAAKRLVAYLAAPQGILPELRGQVSAHLPEYMMPAAWVFLDELPVTSHGKVERRALARIEPAAGARDARGAPRTPTEERLAGLWSDLLGVEPERVGTASDFFDLGGHSLLALRLSSRVREAFGIELPLRAFFEAPVLAEQTRRIDTAAGTAGTGQAARSAPPPPSRELTAPLSPAQERLWFLDRLAPGTPFHNNPSALRLAGTVDVSRLEGALHEVVRRHEVLRTTFHEVDGEPRQLVDPDIRIGLPVLDLRGLPSAARETEARRLAVEEATRPFDLERGPLMRAALVRLDDPDWIALFNLHHIVADAWSFAVLVDELSALYAGSVLPRLPVQYAGFAAWQRDRLQGGLLKAQLAWWLEELAGAPMILELPTDRPRPAVRSFQGATELFTLPEGLIRDLAGLGRSEGATPFMVLLAGVQALLGRYTGQEDVLVGSPVAGRNRAEFAELAGLFENTLVLRGRLAGGPVFRDLLARTRDATLGAYAHQELPFELLIDELPVKRSLAYNPLVQVLFALQDSPMELSLPGLTLSPLPLAVSGACGNRGTRGDLAISLTGTTGVAEFAADLFDRTTVLRLLGHLRTLLEGIAADPEARLPDLPLLSGPERHQLGLEWNEGPADEDRTPVHRLFERQVERTPDAPAVVFQGRTLTYSELDLRADALASRLRALGARPEARIGLFVERSLVLPAAVLGIWKSGAAYVPLDPTLPDERLAFQVRDAGLTAVITRDQSGLRRLSYAGPHILTASEEAPSPAKQGRDGEGAASHLAYLVYTSGSTGQPKAVLVEHGQLAHTLAACRSAFDFRAGDRMPCIAPFSFDIFLFELLNPLLAGGTVEILPLRPALEMDRLVESLSEATHFHAVPALMRQVVERARTPLPGLREVFVGGDAVPGELLTGMAAAFPSSRRFVLYGPTEASILCSAWEVPAGAARSLLGRPLPGSALRLTGPDGSNVPVGVAGEIRIGGGGVARGYLHQPELTAEKMVPGEDGLRWYRTGDLARWLADGTLEFLGRIDNQIKVRGFRIEPGEIEAALGSHPAVAEAVVVVREDRPGDRRLAAYLVPAAGEEPTAADLQAFLRRSLPDYMVPSVFVRLTALPLNRSGKVDRRALPAPDEVARESAASYVPPRNEMEERIASVWREVLGVGRVGVHDSFFDLGGHSLLLLHAMSRLQEALGRDLPKGLMFEHPTIASMAAALGEASTPAAAPAPTLERSQDRAAARRESLRQRQRPGSQGANRKGEDR